VKTNCQACLYRFLRFAFSKISRSAAVFAVLLLASASPALAQTNARLYTPITGAQTQIDTNHSTNWKITVAAGQTISLDGGNFTIKRGSATSTNIVLKVYDGQSDTDTLLASKSLAHNDSSIFTSFTETLFIFSSAASLPGGLSGKTYLVTLTSNAPDVQSEAFFIKGGNSPTLGSPTDRNATISATIGTVAVATSSPLVTLTKSASSTGTVGVAMDYTFTLGNSGSAATPTTSITMEEQLPSGMVANSATSEVERLYHLRSADDGRQHNRAKRRRCVGQCPQGFQPGQSGHGKIQQQDVRPQRTNKLYRLFAVRRFTNDSERPGGMDDIAQPNPHHRMVICNHDARRRPHHQGILPRSRPGLIEVISAVIA
jgi:hypothetical protein